MKRNEIKGCCMTKSVAITNFLDAYSKANFGRSRSDAMSQNICVMCGENASEFHDDLSRKEYTISGMCQKCQDSVFCEQ